MNRISSAPPSGAKYFSTKKQTLPKIFLGSVCVVAGIILGSEWMRERSSINLPLYNKTIIPIPTQEMNRLTQIQLATEQQCNEAYKTFQSQEMKVNTLYQNMKTKDWMLYNTPELSRPFIGGVIGANLEDINTYHDALTKIELQKFSLNQCQSHLHTINEQVAQLHNWAQAEGNLITHRQATQTMNEFINCSDHAINDYWQKFSHLEKINFYVPTDFLREKFSAITGADSQKVSEYIKQNDILNQFQGELRSLKQGIQSDYQKIFASIHKTIELDSSYLLGVVHAKEILHAYKLSARLHVAANNAWYKILDYHFADQIATDNENALLSCLYCSESHRDDLEIEAFSARLHANIAKLNAQTQINYVQKLAAELDPQITKFHNHGKKCDANPGLKHPLHGAVLRIELADFWEKLSSPSLNLFFNIAKTFTHFNIQDELNGISKNAKLISAQLENILIETFMSERLLRADKNILITTDTSEMEAQNSLRSYLNNWAKPGFIEHM